MKLSCFIERYVCHAKATSTHCYRTLIIHTRFYFCRVKKNYGKSIKDTCSLKETIDQLLTDMKSILQIKEQI